MDPTTSDSVSAPTTPVTAQADQFKKRAISQLTPMTKDAQPKRAQKQSRSDSKAMDAPVAPAKAAVPPVAPVAKAADPVPVAKADPVPVAKADPVPVAKADPVPAAKADSKMELTDIDFVNEFENTQQQAENRGRKSRDVPTVPLFFASIYSILLAIMAKIDAHAPRNVENKTRARAYSSTIYNNTGIKAIRSKTLEFINFIWRFQNTTLNKLFVHWHAVCSSEDDSKYMEIPGYELSEDVGKRWLKSNQLHLQHVFIGLAIQLHWLCDRVYRVKFDDETPLDIVEVRRAGGERFSWNPSGQYTITFAEDLKKFVLYFLDCQPLIQASEEAFAGAGNASRDIGNKSRAARQDRDRKAIEEAVSAKKVVPPRIVISKPFPPQQIAGKAWNNKFDMAKHLKAADVSVVASTSDVIVKVVELDKQDQKSEKVPDANSKSDDDTVVTAAGASTAETAGAGATASADDTVTAPTAETDDDGTWSSVKAPRKPRDERSNTGFRGHGRGHGRGRGRGRN